MKTAFVFFVMCWPLAAVGCIVAHSLHVDRKHKRKMREIRAIEELRMRAAWERRNGNNLEALQTLDLAVRRLEGIHQEMLRQ